MAKGIKVPVSAYGEFKVVPHFVESYDDPQLNLAVPGLYFRKGPYDSKGKWKHIADLDEEETRALAAALLKSLEQGA